jgi:hypothetical protein
MLAAAWLLPASVGWADDKPADPVPVVQSVELGAVKVSVAECYLVTVDRAEHFAVTVKIENTSTDKKINYETWRSYRLTPADKEPLGTATMTDAAGNTYGAAKQSKRAAMLQGGSSVPLKGDMESATVSLYPGVSVFERLLFEPPVKSFKYLYVKVPGANIGTKEDATLKISPGDVGKPLVVTSAPPVRRSDYTPPDPREAKNQPKTKPAPKPPAEAKKAPAAEPTPDAVATPGKSASGRPKPFAAGRIKEVERYEDADADERAAMVAKNAVSLIDAPLPVVLETVRGGWAYCRPTEGPLKGKLICFREEYVVKATAKP